LHWRHQCLFFFLFLLLTKNEIKIISDGHILRWGWYSFLNFTKMRFCMFFLWLYWKDTFFHITSKLKHQGKIDSKNKNFRKSESFQLRLLYMTGNTISENCSSSRRLQLGVLLLTKEH
jgi:hypothetical protein